MNARTSRRQFLRQNLSAALVLSAGPTLVPSLVLGRAAQPGPNSRIQVGCIGVGPQGRGVMSNFLPQGDCRVIALCDVAKRNLDEAVKMVNGHYRNQDVATYHDFRDLLARKDIDAVLIATPDHWHVPVAVAAGRAGKDMYVEKPLGLSVEEDQLLRKVCQQKKRIFQFGTQQRSQAQFRLACELVRNGRLGKLRHINVWSAASRPGGPTQPVPPPGDLDYDLWLGPAPKVPYTTGKAFDEGEAWKTWWYNYDYALGFVAGWGVHPLDIAYWGYPEMAKAPFEIEGRGVFPTEGACNTAIAFEVNFTFPGDVSMTYRGTRNGYEPVTPLNDLGPWEKKYGRAADHGTAFEGTDGWVLVDRGAIRASPETLVETKFGDRDLRLPQSSNHVRNFLDSVQRRTPAICPIEDSVQADILCHLSDLATRLNRKLRWDPARERFLKDPEANRRLRMRPMRDPWRLR